jgi:hypothetical protein
MTPYTLTKEGRIEFEYDSPIVGLCTIVLPFQTLTSEDHIQQIIDQAKLDHIVLFEQQNGTD